jgi:hypothetical protein
MRARRQTTTSRSFVLRRVSPSVWMLRRWEMKLDSSTTIVESRPNLMQFSKMMRTEEGELRMGIWSATTEIKKGEEILVSYGKGWWKARDGRLIDELA